MDRDRASGASHATASSGFTDSPPSLLVLFGDGGHRRAEVRLSGHAVNHDAGVLRQILRSEVLIDSGVALRYR